MSGAVATRILRIRSETEGNARLDGQAQLDRLRDAGWREVSRVWAPYEVSWGQQALKGWWWAKAAAGGQLTITMVRDPGVVAYWRLLQLAETEGAMDALVAFVRSIDRSQEGAAKVLDRGVASLIADGTLGPAAIAALQALPPRVRLEAERANAYLLASTL